MINESQILVLKENNGILEVVTEPIEDCSFIINEIDNATDNPNKTLMDVQSLFLNSITPIRNYYSYLYPWNYASSYIGGAEVPSRCSYSEYREQLDEVINEKKEDLGDTDMKEIISIAESELKRAYATGCKRFIRHQALYKAFKKATNDSSTKMYSRESIGWSSFKYKITDDVKACVYTNFGYGFASYFTLTVSYKDIIIAPFSHIARYYKANMTDIIRCTRDYYVNRDSWNPLFDFVKDFVNQSRSDPQAFVEKYLMNEVDEMMKGLRNIQANTSSVIQMFENQSASLEDYHHLRFISPMSSDEKQLFEVFSHEMPVVFKSEKLTQAALMLERLKELGQAYPKVDAYVTEIESMIKGIRPEIEDTINHIQEDIISNEKKKEAAEEKKSMLESKAEPFKDELQQKTKELPKGYSYVEAEALRKDYEKEHPEYVLLKEQIQDLTKEIQDVGLVITRRKALVSRLTSCINSIRECLEPAA